MKSLDTALEITDIFIQFASHKPTNLHEIDATYPVVSFLKFLFQKIELNQFSCQLKV